MYCVIQFEKCGAGKTDSKDENQEKRSNPCPCTQILSIIFNFNFRNWFYAGNSRPISHAVQVNFPEYWSVPKQHHCGINFYMSWVEGMRWQLWKVQRRLNHKWNVSSVTYLKCWTVMAFMPVWQLTRRSEVTGFDFTPAESFSWLFFIFHKVPKGRRERFQVTPRSRWPSSTPFSLHHWSRRTQQMAIAVLVTPVEAGPGPLLSTREKAGKGREAQGWCWISHPTASGLVNLELKDTGGGGGWMVGAVYWCLTNRVCLCTLQTYCLCSQLWLTVTGSTLMNLPFIL